MSKCHPLPLHRPNCCILYVVPVPDNVRIGPTPAVDNAGQFLFWDTAFQSPHTLEGAHATLIAAGQRRHFSLRAKLCKRTTFADVVLGLVEHHGSRGLIDQAVASELFQDPRLIGQPRDHAGLDCAIIRNDKPAAIRWNKRGTDQLGQDERWRTEGHFQQFKLSLTHQLTSQGQIFELVLWQVLYLH